eukprot:SAG11_NODE_32843_length_280_cov_1.060773_1_plen_82_part_01
MCTQVEHIGVFIEGDADLLVHLLHIRTILCRKFRLDRRWSYGENTHSDFQTCCAPILFFLPSLDPAIFLDGIRMLTSSSCRC